MYSSDDTIILMPQKGDIPLFVKGGVFLHSRRDIIKLHPIPEGAPYKLLLGLTINFTCHGMGPKDSPLSDTLRAIRYKFTMPGSTLPYVGMMEHWHLLSEISPGKYEYRPENMTITGEPGDLACFSILDSYSNDPGLPYAQYGKVVETDKTGAPRERWSLYRAGLNVTMNDASTPDWADDIPPAAVLAKLMKPGMWKGVYKLDLDIGACNVHADFANWNYATMLVWLGHAIYDTGQLSFVSQNYAGDKTKNWPTNLWAGTILKMLSGNAIGKEYVITHNFPTDSNPPWGLPPNENLLEVLYPGHTPAADGAVMGDSYIVKSNFVSNIEKVVFEKIYFGPGPHEGQSLHYTFEIQ